MDPREPAGRERGKGKSAELSTRARMGGGAVGNTRRTVCGMGRRCAIRLQSFTPRGVLTVGRSVPLPTFSFAKIKIKVEGTQMKFQNITGSIVAMVTPFHPDGSVNFEALTNLLEWHIAEGTDGILTLGTTGEYPTMSHEEDASVVEHTIRVVNGRVPVIVGSGSNCTATQLEKSIQYQDMGADALLLISPYYNKANGEGMYRHFAETADKVNIPCLLYNVPGRTGCSIPVSTVERLSKHPNIAGIKEASGDMSYAMKIAHCIGPDFAMYSGNDDITLPILSIGGSGVISVYANIMPKMCHQIVRDYLDGNQDQARANTLKYLKLMNDLFMEVNPIPVKTAMNMMGLNAGTLRLPLCEMTAEHQAALRNTMKEAGLL